MPAGSRESGIVSAGAVGLPIAVTFCPSANIGDATVTGGAVGVVAGAIDEEGVDGGIVGAPLGPVDATGGGRVSDADGGVAGASAGGVGGGTVGSAGFGLVATAGGSEGLSPVKGASQSASCSGSMAR
jgi:hypothetical protein